MMGPLALVGGDEWREGCSFDAELAGLVGASEVLVIPAAAAFEHPAAKVAMAAEWFAGFGLSAVGVPVLSRGDALEGANAERVRRARFVYLAGGSSLHLRSVLKGTPVLDALVAAWRDGAAVAGAGAGAEVLCDPMLDPRGGAFTVGLGLAAGMTVVSGASDHFSADHHRTLGLAGPSVAVAAVPARTALIHDTDGWRVGGIGQVSVFRDQVEVGLAGLPVQSTEAP